MLIALYEHKIFTQGIIWNINSFDQWGVELRQATGQGDPARTAKPGTVTSHDSSTNGLINHLQGSLSGHPWQRDGRHGHPDGAHHRRRRLDQSQ
jgi:hypothetical protein